MKRIIITLSAAALGLSIFFYIPGNTHAVECKDKRPAGPPILYEAVPSEDSVLLRWEPAPDPVTYYLVRFGKSKENLEYGLPNIGGRETTSFTVLGLESGQKYYFQVRAGNGCRPGELSNTLTAIVGKPINNTVPAFIPDLAIEKKVLGASESAELQENHATPSAAATEIEKTTDQCTGNCSGGVILIGLSLVLLLFYIASIFIHKLTAGYSIFIPAIAVGAYYFLHGSCDSSAFWCRYFIPLTIIIYLFAVLSIKNRDHFRHSAVTKSKK